MTSPQPSSPGDVREDHAQQVAALAGSRVAQAELVVIATVAMLAKRVATGSMPLAVARKRLTRTTDVVLAASVQRALLGDARTAGVLAPSFNAAVQFAATDAQAALTAATVEPSTGQPATAPSLPRIQATQKALAAFAAVGLVGFVDKAGRRWNLATYTEMATRAAVSNAWDATRSAALTRAGIDLVLVDTHSTEGSCALCRPWLGRTLSLTGVTPGYPTLADAQSAGFRHPNCRCSWGPPGTLTVLPSPAELAQSAAMYKTSQHQRALDHRVRAAHRSMAAAVTPHARNAARRHLNSAIAAATQHRHGHRPTVVNLPRQHPPRAR
jgi:hypothetical protein